MEEWYVRLNNNNFQKASNELDAINKAKNASAATMGQAIGVFKLVGVAKNPVNSIIYKPVK